MSCDVFLGVGTSRFAAIRPRGARHEAVQLNVLDRRASVVTLVLLHVKVKEPDRIGCRHRRKKRIRHDEGGPQKYACDDTDTASTSAAIGTTLKAVAVEGPRTTHRAAGPRKPNHTNFRAAVTTL